jgi:hypothetical protein
LRKRPLEEFDDALKDVTAFLQSISGKGVMIGGIAVAVIARARTTNDIDATVFPITESVDELYKAATKFHLEPRVVDYERFTKQSRVMLFTHTPSNVNIDISLGVFPFEEHMIRTAAIYDLSGISVPVARPEDLIVMKAIAHRLQDLADIELILKVRPEVDREEVLANASQFAMALDIPEIMIDLQKLLKSHPPSAEGN